MRYKLIERYTQKTFAWDKLNGLDLTGKKKMPAWAAAKFERMLKEGSWAKGTKNYHYQINQHGGSRPGAGRKRGGRNQEHIANGDRRVNVGIRLPKEMSVWIKKQDMPAGRIIEDALRVYRGIKNKK